jgi:hypothetical protein
LHAPNEIPRAIASVLLGIAIAIALLWTIHGLPAPPSPGTVAFDGINLTIDYTGASPAIFGPVHQNACLQPSQGTILARPNCPTTLSGGKEYGFEIYWVIAPDNVSDVFVNLSLYSSVPFSSVVCIGDGSPPPMNYSYSESLALPTGQGCAWGVTIFTPNPAPEVPSGLWMTALPSAHVIV